MASALSLFQSADPVTLVTELKREANSYRQLFHDQWRKNKRADIGDHYTKTSEPGQSQHVINFTRTAIMGMLSVMTQEPPDVLIEPMEGDEPGMYYMKGETGGRLQNQIEQIFSAVEQGQLDVQEVPRGIVTVSQQMDDGQLTGQIPIIPEHFKTITQTQNPLTGKNFAEEEDFFRFDDVAIADLLQRGLDGVSNRYQWDKLTMNFQHAALDIGHRDVIVEYDDQIDDPQAIGALEEDTWIDPNASVTDITNAQYFIYAQIIDVDQAIRKFPEHAETIMANAEDPSSAAGLDGQPLSDRYNKVDWERDIAIIYTCWIRNQKMKIKVSDGGDGLIEDEVTGLREIRIVGGAVISDGPSRYRTIPATRFKFLTIVDSPYSIGLPEILQDPQAVLNTLFTNLSDHTKFLPHPQSWMIEEVAEKFQNKKAIFAKANDPISVPAELAADMKHAPVNFVTPPSLDPSHIALLDRVISIFHDIASQSDVARGVASSKAESGIAIGQLQEASNRTLNLASKFMDHAMSSWYKIAYQNMLDFMPIEKWMNYVSKYPQHILENMLKRARKAEFEVKVVTSGTKQQRRLEDQQKALLMVQNQKMSTRTFLEKMGIDNPDQEEQRIVDEQVDLARAQAASIQSQMQNELQSDVALDKSETESKILLEQVKSEFDMKLEILKGQIELMIQKNAPKPEKASS